MASDWPQRADVVLIGGGFYGCCLALYLRSIARKVVILEARDELLTRASYVNQARIHTGFHYPRSFVTARRSLALYRRFMDEFRDAVVDDFQMLYAIARSGSKITPQRFEKMFADMDAPIARASDAERALFNPDLITDVFRCQEYAFDAVALRNVLLARLRAADIHVVTNAKVVRAEPNTAPDPVTLHVEGRPPISAPLVIDATYGQISAEGIMPAMAALKFELTEVALVEPPEELRGIGVTVMDGPFFSTMPFPAENCYSLTHVRYTPHRAWTSQSGPPSVPAADPPRSHWLHMQRDAMRYMPCLSGLTWRRSLYEVKTVLVRNEADDGRPILLESHPANPGLISVLGGKFDNIYDLFDALESSGGAFAGAHTRYLEPGRAS